MKPLRTFSRLMIVGCLAFGHTAGTAANATTLVKLSTEQMTDASDYIVRGTVQAITAGTDERGHIWTHVTIDVDERLKGPMGLQTLTVDVQGGTMGARATVVPLSPRFAIGESVLAFAEILESGVTTVTGMMQGKYTVRIAPEDGREMLVRFAPRQDRDYDPRFIPHPQPNERVYLNDLSESVRARKATGWDGLLIPGKSIERLKAMHPTVKVMEVAQ